MKNLAARDARSGTAPAEKLESLGIACGKTVDIRMLDQVSRDYGVAVYLFFEEALARERTLESVREEFDTIPEFERPYVEVGSFLRFTRENDPSFDQTLREFPLMVTVVSAGETSPGPGGNPVPYISALMPFLDDLEIDAHPA